MDNDINWDTVYTLSYHIDRYGLFVDENIFTLALVHGDGILQFHIKF